MRRNGWLWQELEATRIEAEERERMERRIEKRTRHLTPRQIKELREQIANDFSGD